MRVIHIVAITEDNGIGKDNNLICRLPNDLKRFKSITENSYIITGRKNYEAIGRNLPNRTTIIITRNKDYKAKDCIIVNSVKEAFEIVNKHNQEKVFIIGGGEVYKQTLKYTNEIYLTLIKTKLDADVFYPVLGNEFIEESRIENKADDKNEYDHDFIKLVRDDNCK